MMQQSTIGRTGRSSVQRFIPAASRFRVHRIASLLIALAITGCGGPSDEIKDLNSRGLAEYRAGRYSDAVAIFKKAA